MWAEYKDKANFTKTRMLEEEKAKVYHALVEGAAKPPHDAAIEHIIEALWWGVVEARKGVNDLYR